MNNQLLLGAGSRRVRMLDPDFLTGRAKVPAKEFSNLTTLDMEAAHNPDILCNLEDYPWPPGDDSFDEIHAYEVLEHLGSQGNFQSFFRAFYECWRILKPGGFLCATVPHWASLWAWGDPGHTRIINSGSLVFLSQAEYARQVGHTPMSDYRRYWRGDFETVWQSEQGDTFAFILRAIK